MLCLDKENAVLHNIVEQENFITFNWQFGIVFFCEKLFVINVLSKNMIYLFVSWRLIDRDLVTFSNFI